MAAFATLGHGKTEVAVRQGPRHPLVPHLEAASQPHVEAPSAGGPGPRWPLALMAGVAVKAMRRDGRRARTRAGAGWRHGKRGGSGVAVRAFVVGNKVAFKGVEGSVRYVGPTKFADGQWVGVELDRAEGMHNGTVLGVCYFVCEDGHGIFAQPADLVSTGGWDPDAAAKGPSVTSKVLKLRQLGRPASEKALQINLDPELYGSFAEIGAGQEVSRTFLTAGAAAGTVARSLSAYDMRMSDVTYGTSKRYVTEERCRQMMDKEYQLLEENLRETRGNDTRFFSLATTLAAKAYMSDRECEGWVGFTFQHEKGAEKSTVVLHVRMCDDSAPKQGEAIGILGTNLVYLADTVEDPYLIASFLLDGLDTSRLEIDYINFEGPKWPYGSVDQRLLAMRMVQFRVALSVLLDYDEQTKRYHQVVPNNALYKQTVVVQRSRFRPVTFAHREVMEASSRQLGDMLGEMPKPPMKILNLQIDDIVRPPGLVRTQGRLDRAQKLCEADTDGDGYLTLAELRELASKRLPEDQVDEMLQSLDLENTGKVSIDSLLGVSRESLLVQEFLDRFNMIEPLKFPVLVSGLRRTHSLASYLARYTKQDIAVTIGGGNYNIEKGLFNEGAYKRDKGGMLEAFGRLFQGNVKIFQYPNVSPDGEVSDLDIEEGSWAEHLHNYLVATDKIVLIDKKNLSKEVLDQATNERFRGQSSDVMELIAKGSDEWTKYVPDEVAEIVKKRSWFKNLSSGNVIAGSVYGVLNEL